VPTVADRVVQTAILLVLQPLLDPRFERTTFGFRPGRSVADAIAALVTEVEATGHTTVLTTDVAKAFDSVPHDGLFEVLHKTLGGRNPLTELIKRIVSANGPKGIPQG